MNEENEGLKRSIFIKLTHGKSKEKVKSANKNILVKLTPSDIDSIQDILKINLSKEQIAKINRYLKEKYQDEKNEAYENYEELYFDKSSAVIEGLTRICNIEIDVVNEYKLHNAIQTSITETERREIIDGTANSLENKVKYTFYVVVAVGVTTAAGIGIKQLSDFVKKKSKENTTTIEIDMDEYGRYVDSEGNKVEEKEDGEYTVDTVSINNLIEENDFRSSLKVDGTDVDISEITVTEDIEKTAESAVNSINTQDEIISYTAGIIEAEYNDVTNNNISVTSYTLNSDTGSLYVDDEGVLRISKENSYETVSVARLFTVDADGNNLTLKYTKYEDEYVRVYDEDEEDQGKQTIDNDVFDLIYKARDWYTDYYDKTIISESKQVGYETERVPLTDASGNPVYYVDTLKDAYKEALIQYKTRKVQEEIQEDYVQE